MLSTALNLGAIFFASATLAQLLFFVPFERVRAAHVSL